MTTTHIFIRICLFGCALLGVVPAARAEQRLSAEDWALAEMYLTVRPGRAIKHIRLPMDRRFRSADLDGGGISALDYKLKRDKLAARYRSGWMKNWFARDLNGDGRVTRAEFERFFSQKARRRIRSGSTVLGPTREQVAKRLHDMIAKALEADANSDQTVTLAEAMADAARRAERTIARQGAPRAKIPNVYDLNGDGSITWAEYSKSVEGALRRVDRNGDGTVSKAEYQAILPSMRRLSGITHKWEHERSIDARKRRLAKVCRIPKAPAGARIILLGLAKGRALSSVGLDGDDALVYVANVRIEPGKQPLFVVMLSSAPMIWRFSGAVRRITTIAVSSSRSPVTAVQRVGVTGVPRARVYMPPRSDCLQIFSNGTPEDRNRTTRNAKILLGRVPDVIALRDRVETVVLPRVRFEPYADGEPRVTPARAGIAARLWRQMLYYYPSGVARVDAKTVVSRAPAKDYRVLPQEAGLAQLVERGDIRFLGTRQGLVNFGRQRFLILKRTRIPYGLVGNRAVVFELPEGVPRPEGRLGHSILVRAVQSK